MDPNTKDQNVLSFMMQLAQQKYGDELDVEFLENESNRLYDEFGNRLVEFFEPILTEEQRQKFDALVERNAGQDEILEFLMTSIQDLDVKIQQILIAFRDNYLKSEG